MAALIPTRRFVAACLGLAVAAAAQGAVLHDPWLERFQVGQFRDPDRVPLADGWPAGLLAPFSLDPGWQAGAAVVFAAAELPRDLDLVTWRIALPALATPAAAEAYYADVRRQWQLLCTLAAPDGPLPIDVAPGPGPWSRPIRLFHASRLWAAGDSVAAARAAAAIVDDAGSLGLSPAETFAWTLRADCLAARSGGAPRRELVWRALRDLGPYDTRSGWAVWVACRRHRDEAPLSPGVANRDTGIMLATAGQLWLTTAELRAAGFPADVEAGLGAILLPVGELADHFARWPAPPADGLFQSYWLRGQRRIAAGAAALERLAALPGLKDGHRLDHWRRASEGRLLEGDWTAGLRDLDAALALLRSDASAAMQDRLREWVVQALALALAGGRTGDAERLVALAEQRFDADQAAAFRTDATALLGAIGRPGAPVRDDLRSRAEDQVRRGNAPRIDRAATNLLPDAVAWRDGLWTRWARWGLALLAAPDTADAVAREYRRGLETVLAEAEPWRRHTTGCSVAAGALRGWPRLPALLDWALERDIDGRSGGTSLPRTSPLPDLHDTGPTADLRNHALLGVAIALGDDRGLLAMAVRLPQAAVPESVRWPFWYPVPADPAVRAALTESGLPPELLLAIARNESLFEPAVRSRAGALGYMQIMPFHYADPAGPPGPGHWSHPAASLGAGARIVGDEARRYGGDPYRAVAAYNAGRGAVDRWDGQLGGRAEAAVFLAWIGYPETRGYTLRVLRDREIYRTLFEAGP